MLKRAVTLFCFLTYFPKSNYGQAQNYENDLEAVAGMINVTSDVIQDTDRRISFLLSIKRKNSDNAAFEIGYLTYDIQEKYRRMVDKYNTSIFMRPKLYLIELVLYLEEIERHYWEINHISNMLHEIERKYDVNTDLEEEYNEDIKTSPSGDDKMPSEYVDQRTRSKRRRTKRFKHDRYFIEKIFSTKKTTTTRWPIDYGWEIDYDWWNQ